jgi:putative oxidoreductase
MELELSPTLASTLLDLGRVLVGGVFLFAGLRNARNVPLLTSLMKARGVPFARPALFAGIATEIIGGAALLAAVFVPFAVAALVLFVLLATPMFHNFWSQQGLERATALNGFVANVAITGGLLAIAAI